MVMLRSLATGSTQRPVQVHRMLKRWCRDAGCVPMQGIDGVPKISQDYNPATWMLEVTNVAVENRTGQDFAALYATSDMHQCVLSSCRPVLSRSDGSRFDKQSKRRTFLKPTQPLAAPLCAFLSCTCLFRADHTADLLAFLECRRAQTMIDELKVPQPGSEPLHFPTEYAVSRFAQLRTILWKNACVYWRYTGALGALCTALNCGNAHAVSDITNARCIWHVTFPPCC